MKKERKIIQLRSIHLNLSKNLFERINSRLGNGASTWQKSGSDAAEFKRCKSPRFSGDPKMVDTGAPITRPALNSELRHCGVHLPVRKRLHTDGSPSIIRARGGERAKVGLAVRDGMSPLYWRTKRRMRHRSRTRLLQFWNLVNKHLTAALTGYLVQPSSRPCLWFLFFFSPPPIEGWQCARAAI